MHGDVILLAAVVVDVHVDADDDQVLLHGPCDDDDEAVPVLISGGALASLRTCQMPGLPLLLKPLLLSPPANRHPDEKVRYQVYFPSTTF